MKNILQKEILEIIKKNFNLKNKFYLHEPNFRKDDEKNIIHCLKTGFVSTSGKYTRLLEKKLQLYTKSKYVIGTINGTSAIHTLLKILNIQENDEVLVPSLTFVATANSIIYCKAIPNFVDVTSYNFGVDPDKLDIYLKKNCIIKNKKCFNKKTKRYIKALICVHIFGHACSIEKLKLICKKYNLDLIEDAAEGIGSYYKNKHLGTFANYGVISFNGNKTITTGGGGAILLSKKNDYLKALKMVMVNKEKHPYEYYYKSIGFNYRMPSINAALGISQLNNINKLINHKRKNFKFYNKIFKQNKEVKILQEPKNCKSNYWLNTLILNNKNKKCKNKIIKLLAKNNFYSRPLWYPVHKLPYFKKCPKDNLSVTNDLYSRSINLPSSSNLLKKNNLSK